MQKGLWKHLHSKCLPVWALKNLLDVERGFRQMSWFSCEYWLSLIGVRLLVHLADMAKCTTGAVVWWIITIYMFIFGPFLYWDGFFICLIFSFDLFFVKTVWTVELPPKAPVYDFRWCLLSFILNGIHERSPLVCMYMCCVPLVLTARALHR